MQDSLCPPSVSPSPSEEAGSNAVFSPSPLVSGEKKASKKKSNVKKTKMPKKKKTKMPKAKKTRDPKKKAKKTAKINNEAPGRN